MKPILCILFLSLTSLISHTPEHHQELRPNKDFALFFAVDTYDDRGWNDLKNPIRDAEAVARELKEVYGFETVIHRNKSKEEIFDIIFQWQEKETIFGDDGQLLVFFSGHGDFEERVKKGYFIPKDGKANDRLHITHLGSIQKSVSRL